jgi:hypothetical protein
MAKIETKIGISYGMRLVNKVRILKPYNLRECGRRFGLGQKPPTSHLTIEGS